MNIAYPISEILKCVEIINQPKKKFDRNSDKTFNLNNTVGIKKKINQTQGTFGESFETEELIEETFNDSEPFEITELWPVNRISIPPPRATFIRCIPRDTPKTGISHSRALDKTCISK